MPTKKALDTFYYANEVDLDNYSLLVAAGGDGTYHEVANGMLARKDKKKIPFGMLPNGSGNDTCSAMGIFTLDHALDYIVNGMVTPIDTIQVLIDCEKDDQDWSIEDRLRYGRHCLINSCMSMPALINNEAAKFKLCCGKASYTVATLEQAMLGKIR